MKTKQPNTVIEEKLAILKREFPAITKYFNFNDQITEVKVCRVDGKFLMTRVERYGYMGSLSRRIILIGNDGNWIIQIGWRGFAQTQNPLKLLWRWFNGNGITFNETVAEGIIRAGVRVNDTAYIAENSFGDSFIIHKTSGPNLLAWAEEVKTADIKEFQKEI